MSGSIYTRHGDDGTTSLVGGQRLSKDSPRVEAYGTLDEANSALELARAALEAAEPGDALLDPILHFVQQRFMNCSSNLATPPDAQTEHTPCVTADDVTYLEGSIDTLLDAAGEIDHFVLPAGCEEACRLHVARTIVRRAERRISTLAADEPVDDDLRAFVNRSSDLLFAAARYANNTHGNGDRFWDPTYTR